MTQIRRVFMAGALLLVVACGGGGQPTTAPTSQPTGIPTDAATPATEAPASAAPTATSGASLDPSQSDAGIVAQATISNDTRGERDGTYTIIGTAADASDCSVTFEGDQYIAVAWDTTAPDGQIRRLGVSVAADDIPAEDGEVVAGINDGGASLDFTSPSGIGTTYGGNATRDNEGSSEVTVTRVGAGLIFDFTGVTWDNVNFAGQLVCAEG